jgi:cyclopropane-fatty-acyl-phospholipid synthase
VLVIGIALAERIGASPVARRLAPLLARRKRHSRAEDAEDVRYHYDVSNDFYRLWLDRHMIYSCAYFATGGEDLDTAQELKLDHLCRRAGPRPWSRRYQYDAEAPMPVGRPHPSPSPAGFYPRV